MCTLRPIRHSEKYAIKNLLVLPFTHTLNPSTHKITNHWSYIEFSQHKHVCDLNRLCASQRCQQLAHYKINTFTFIKEMTGQIA